MNIDDSVRKFISLSKRQKEVLRRVCKGMPYKKIAMELFIAKSTVKAHMAQIYTKLDLIDLPRDERIYQIRSIYCPLLKQEEAKKGIIVVEPEIDDEEQEEEEDEIDEVISPEMNAIIIYDEKALTTLEGGSESMQSDIQYQKPKKKKKSIVFRIFGTLVILTALGLMVTGGYVAYKVFICGETPGWLVKEPQPAPEGVAVEPVVPAPEVEVQEAPQVEIGEVEKPAIEIVAAEPIPVPTAVPVQPTAEIVIVPTVAPTVEVLVQKEYYDVGEWAKEGNVSVRLKEYNIRQDHAMELYIEVWNKSSKDVLFSWSPNVCFTLTDNTGNIYEIWDPYDYSALDNEVVEASQVQVIRYKGQNAAAAYVNDPMFNSEVTELYLIIQEFSVFRNVKFKITK
jgi:regulatory LuxR family protein